MTLELEKIMRKDLFPTELIISDIFYKNIENNEEKFNSNKKEVPFIFFFFQINFLFLSFVELDLSNC